MSLWIEIVCVAAATLALFGAPSLLLMRFRGLGPIGRQLAAMTLRLLLVAVFAIALAFALGRTDHRVTLVLTVAATYLLAALCDGVRHFRNRGTIACSTR